MPESLSIRAYEPIVRSHIHAFQQIVVPLRGAIEISLEDFNGLVGVGHCVIIREGVKHRFIAQEQARFLVADLEALPESAASTKIPVATVSSAFKSFCQFADVQLGSQQHAAIERSMIGVFKELLSLQGFLPELDPRISRSLEYIGKHIGGDCSLARLSDVATLSASQFKLLFEKHTGGSLSQYLLTMRMEKARAQLANTDTPVSIVADSVGYADPSAFSRAFQKYYGASPREYKKKRHVRSASRQSK